MWPPLTVESLEEKDTVEKDDVEEEDERLPQSPELSVPIWPVLQARTGLVYDQQMMDHHNLWDK